jgi:U6 snRNA-associated Sm-like protein LSm3
MSVTATPLDFLRLCLTRKVKVQVMDDRELVGTMEGFDEHCNLLLNEITETLTVDRFGPQQMTHTRSIALLFIRGDQVITVSPVA